MSQACFFSAKASRKNNINHKSDRLFETDKTEFLVNNDKSKLKS